MAAPSKDSAEAATEATAHAIQEAVDAEHDKGYAGHTVDETPREHYSVKGVLAGKPTPEFTELEKQ